MRRATPVEMRKALELVRTMSQAGVAFVPMPVLDEADGAALLLQASQRFDQLARQATDTN